MKRSLMYLVATLLIAGLAVAAMARPPSMVRPPLMIRPPSIDGQLVQVDGQAVEGASSEVLIEKQVIEFREAGSDVVQLIPGPATYRVCIASRQLIPAVEAACAPGSDDPFLDIVVEDGRGFQRCLVEYSNTLNRFSREDCTVKRPGTRYCFRCEGTQ